MKERVCVCVRVKERVRQRVKERERERERERENFTHYPVCSSSGNYDSSSESIYL